MELLTAKQIAEMFNVTPATVQHWAARGWLQGKRMGRSWFFTEEAVKAAMEVR